MLPAVDCDDVFSIHRRLVEQRREPTSIPTLVPTSSPTMNATVNGTLAPIIAANVTSGLNATINAIGVGNRTLPLSPYTCNLKFNQFLFGFLIILSFHSGISIIASTASALRDDKDKKRWMARAKYVVGFSSTVLLGYCIWGLTLVWDASEESKCHEAAREEYQMSLAIVVFFLAFPCACLAIRIPSQKITKEFAKASKRTQTKQEKNLLRTGTSVVSI